MPRTKKVPENLPAEFGTIVNAAKPDEELEVIEEKIALLEEKQITVTVNKEVIGSLQDQARFRGMSVEDWAAQILAESVNVQIGQATIIGPSTMSGQRCTPITGPSRDSRYFNDENIHPFR